MSSVGLIGIEYHIFLAGVWRRTWLQLWFRGALLTAFFMCWGIWDGLSTPSRTQRIRISRSMSGVVHIWSCVILFFNKICNAKNRTSWCAQELQPARKHYFPYANEKNAGITTLGIVLHPKFGYLLHAPLERTKTKCCISWRRTIATHLHLWRCLCELSHAMNL